MSSDPSTPARTRLVAWSDRLTRPLGALEAAFYAIPPIAVVSDPSPNALLFITLAVAGIGALRAGWRPAAPGRWPAFACATFAAWCAMTGQWSHDPADSLTHTGKVVAILVAAWLLWDLTRHFLEFATTRTRRRLARAATAGLALGIAALVLELAFDHPLQRLFTWNWSAEGKGVRDADTNRGASLIAILAWICVPLVGRRLSGPSTALGLTAGIVASMLLTESAATQVGFLAGAAFFAVASVGPWARRAGLALAVLVGLLATPWLAQQAFDRGLHTADWLPSTAQQRIHIWNYAGAWALEKPATGWGFHTSRYISNRGIEPPPGKNSVITMHPHNAGLQIWLELGVPGVLIALAAFGLLAVRIECTGNDWAPWFGAAAVTTFAIADIGYGAWQTQWVAAIAWVVIYARLACRL